MNRQNYVVGIDIGGTNIRIGLIDSYYNLSDFVIESSAQFKSAEYGIEKLIKFVEKYILNVIKSKNMHFKIDAISIGFPSTIDATRKIVVSTPNLLGFNNINIVEHFESKLNIKTFINKDVNLLMLFDMFNSNISDHGISVGFYLGTGFGNAISINGNLLFGKNGSAGELGHIPAFNNDELCSCGNIGCVETIASGKYLKKLCDKELGGVKISDVFIEHIDSPIIDKYIKNIAQPIATEINILDPDNVILGGGVIHMLGFPRDRFENYIKQFARKPYPYNNLEFSYSSISQKNGVIGAGIYAFKML